MEDVGEESNKIEVVGKQIIEFKFLFLLYIIGSHYSTFLYVVWKYIKKETYLIQMKLTKIFSNYIVAHI